MHARSRTRTRVYTSAHAPTQTIHTGSHRHTHTHTRTHDPLLTPTDKQEHAQRARTHKVAHALTNPSPCKRTRRSVARVVGRLVPTTRVMLHVCATSVRFVVCRMQVLGCITRRSPSRSSCKETCVARTSRAGGLLGTTPSESPSGRTGAAPTRSHASAPRTLPQPQGQSAPKR